MSTRYLKALTYAHELHDDQKWRGTDIPYISHLMQVSSSIFEFGGDEDQSIAGLLHDSIEHQRERTSYRIINNIFGDEVERIVRACTDVEHFPKPPWEEQKRMYLNSVASKDNRVKLVIACDALHNTQSILRKIGGDHCDDKKRMLWYYSELARNLQSLGPESVVLKLLLEEVEKMKISF